MSDDFAKFLFLGAMILAVFAGSRGLVYRETERYSAARLTASVVSPATDSEGNPPIFILEPPEESEKVMSDHEPLRHRADKRQEINKKIDPITAAPPLLSENASILPEKPRISGGGDIVAPNVSAAAALVADMMSGRMFFEFSAGRRWPIASITKLVSAAVVSKNFPMHESIAITANDFSFDAPENGLQVGGRYSVQDLIAAMLIKSSNPAAEALARFWGREKFIAEMNRLALEWGLNETYFDDPTGLSSSNQSTAKDLFLLAKNIYERHPEIFEITRRESATITELNSGRKVIINNINLFAGKDYFIGGKTGYTDEASGNLLSVFDHKGAPAVIVVLGTDNRFGETEKLWNWLRLVL